MDLGGFENKRLIVNCMYCYLGNMSRGILWCRVFGSIMECWMQIEVHGLLWTIAIHTETDLYHR